MLSLSGVSSNSYVSQLQLQQAQSAAERAEQAARSLRARAESAQRSADQEQEKARQLRVESGQADQRAGSARQGLSAVESLGRMQDGFDALRQQIADSLSPAATPSVETPTPVVNGDGQMTGVIVNATA